MPERKRNQKMVDRIRKVPKDVHEYIDQVQKITDRIFEILETKGIDQRTLAQKLGKHESEVSKLLSGEHNFTLKTLLKIQSSIGEKIIEVTKEASESVAPDYHYMFIDTRMQYSGQSKIQFISPGNQQNSFSGLVPFWKLNKPITTGVEAD